MCRLLLMKNTNEKKKSASEEPCAYIVRELVQAILVEFLDLGLHPVRERVQVEGVEDDRQQGTVLAAVDAAIEDIVRRFHFVEGDRGVGRESQDLYCRLHNGVEARAWGGGAGRGGIFFFLRLWLVQCAIIAD